MGEVALDFLRLGRIRSACYSRPLGAAQEQPVSYLEDGLVSAAARLFGAERRVE